MNPTHNLAGTDLQVFTQQLDSALNTEGRGLGNEAASHQPSASEDATIRFLQFSSAEDEFIGVQEVIKVLQ